MNTWHWPQYGMAVWYGIILFGTVVQFFKADDEAERMKPLASGAISLLVLVTLHCGGFW